MFSVYCKIFLQNQTELCGQDVRGDFIIGYFRRYGAGK